MEGKDNVRWCPMFGGICRNAEFQGSDHEGKSLFVKCNPCLVDEQAMTLKSIRKDLTSVLGSIRRKGSAAKTSSPLRKPSSPMQRQPRLEPVPPMDDESGTEEESLSDGAVEDGHGSVPGPSYDEE